MATVSVPPADAGKHHQVKEVEAEDLSPEALWKVLSPWDFAYIRDNDKLPCTIIEAESQKIGAIRKLGTRGAEDDEKVSQIRPLTSTVDETALLRIPRAAGPAAGSCHCVARARFALVSRAPLCLFYLATCKSASFHPYSLPPRFSARLGSGSAGILLGGADGLRR